MSTSSKRRHGAVAGCLTVTLCLAVSGCGGDDDAGGEAPATAADRTAPADYGPPPKAQRPQSPEERHVLALAWRLQNLFADRDYEAVCEMLTKNLRQRALVIGNSCPRGLAIAPRDRTWPRPTLAWARLQDDRGVVVMHKRDGDFAARRVELENGEWRFANLAVAGLDWP